MMVSTRRARQMLMLPLMFAGVIGWLFLPGLPLKRASAKSRGATAGPSTQKDASGLDSERQAALVKLYSQVRAGAPTSEEEADILRRFAAGFAVSELEADIVISRALYDYYLSGSELTKEQEVLLARYKSFVAQRATDIRDLKTRVLSEHKIRAAAQGPVAPSAPPVNDTCAGAEVIPGAGPFPYLTAVTDTTMATSTGDPAIPSCTTPASPPPTVVSRTVWYTFTPGATAQYIISSCSNAPTATTVEDTVMGIYTPTSGCAGSFIEWPSGTFTDGCDDDGCAVGALQSVITTRLDAGTVYFIVMSEYGNSPAVAGLTNVQLRVTQALPAANDACAGAAALLLNTPVNGATVAGFIPIANNDYVLSGSACFTGIGQTPSTAGGDDVVYSFTAPSAGSYSFRVYNYSSPDIADLVVYVASSCPAATPGSPVTVTTCLGASNRSSVSTAEEVMCLPLSASQQVFIFVDEVAQSLGSTFTIEVTRCTRETEPNDTPATANALSLGIEGTSSPASDADFYLLGTPPTGSRLFALVDGVAANSSDFDLRVTTTTDTLEYDDRNCDNPFGNLSGTVAGTPLTGVATFLRVNINPALTSEPYRVYSVVQPPIAQAMSEVEPNNTIGQASTGANLYFKGALAGPAPSTDIDIFKFNAFAGDLVYIGLDGDPLRDNTPLDAKLGLLDSAGTTLVEVDDANSVSDNTPSLGTLTGVKPFSPAEGIVYRVNATGTYYARVSVSTIAPTAAAVGDYLLSISKNGVAGGGNDTAGLYDPASSTFFLRNSNSSAPADLVFGYGPAGAGWIPVVGDWNGDGVDTIGLYNPTSSVFFLRNANSSAPADLVFGYGPAGAGWIPIAGDWNGDGIETIGLYDPATSTFFLRNSNSSAPADLVFSYGPAGAGWIPIAGDWNGDGVDTIGLYDPATSTFFLRNANSSAPADLVFAYGPAGAGWKPIAGDWNGDGTETIGLYDPASSTFFLRNSNTSAPADLVFTYGPAGAGWIPIASDWDGL